MHVFCTYILLFRFMQACFIMKICSWLTCPSFSSGALWCWLTYFRDLSERMSMRLCLISCMSYLLKNWLNWEFVITCDCQYFIGNMWSKMFCQVLRHHVSTWSSHFSMKKHVKHNVLYCMRRLVSLRVALRARQIIVILTHIIICCLLYTITNLIVFSHFFIKEIFNLNHF